MSKKTLLGTPDNNDDWFLEKMEEMNNLSEEAVLIINGPNLNFLGIREIEKYGSVAYEELINKVRKETLWKGRVEFFQSNLEGEIVNLIHELVRNEKKYLSRKSGAPPVSKPKIIGIVINPGGLTHTSVSLRDALSMLSMPIVEVHITNINRREDYRKTNLISDLCAESILGNGIDGYIKGVNFLYRKYHEEN